MPHPLLGKTTATLLVMTGVLAIPYAHPKLKRLRVVEAPWDPAEPEPRAEAASEAAPRPALSTGEQKLGAAANEATITNALPEVAPVPVSELSQLAGMKDLPLEDPSGHALDAFYASLAKTAKKEPGAITRILHYGDSVIASDYVSGTMRRRMQETFGDAGHGFILVANPWQWYFHNDVTHHNSEGWEAARLSGPIAPDGIYGLGGVSFKSVGGGIAYFGTTEKGSFGRKVSRFDVYYLEQPGGGDLELTVKGRPAERVPTKGDAKASRVHSVKVPDGSAQMSMRLVGQTRVFGVALERDEPGVVYDALGAHAAMAVYWKQMDAAHWKEQMELRKPALIVWQYGTNESDLWKVDLVEYEANLRMVLEKVRGAAAGVPILVMAPLDRAETSPTGGGLRTKPIVPKLVDVQRKVAIDLKLAFWNTYEAMGGDGAMARWVKTNPKLGGGDLTHPTPAGAEVLGDGLARAVMAGYGAWAKRR